MMRFAWPRMALVASASLLLCGLLPAQNVANDLLVPLPQAPDHWQVWLQERFPPVPADLRGQLGGAGAGDPSAAQPEYFPKVSASFLNLHFDNLMGEEFIVQHPLPASSTTLALPLVGKNQTLVALTAAQPLTPLFTLHQLVNVARADGRIAAAKANGQSIHGAQLLASGAAAPGELSASGEKRPETGSRL